MRICILALALACSIASDAWSADKPVTLALEERTTLRVGELAVLQIPSDIRNWNLANAGNVLVLVHRSGHTLLGCVAKIEDGQGTASNGGQGCKFKR